MLQYKYPYVTNYVPKVPINVEYMARGVSLDINIVLSTVPQVIYVVFIFKATKLDWYQWHFN